MRRRFNVHLEHHRGGRRLLLVCLILVLILIGHDLVMTGGARAGGASATTAYDPAQPSIRTDAFGLHDFHVGAQDSNAVFICTVIQSLSTPDRTCAVEAGAADAIPLMMEMREGPPVITAYATPSLPPDVRRALLQVFRI